jgi:hypothetical protein
MAVADEVRQVLESLLDLEMREIHSRMDAMEEVSRVRYEHIMQRLDQIQRDFAFEKRISDLEASRKRSSTE